MYNVKELYKLCREARSDVIKMLIASDSGHPGSSLSTIEILVVLYNVIMNIQTDNPFRRDKFLLSKGHAAPALYSVLMQKGILSRKYLNSLRKLSSPLQGHPDERFLPELDFSSGSLGQNLSVGVGYAISQKRRNVDSNTYVLLGDGELQEGQIWEAANSASHYKLNNLTAIVDYNKYQLDGPVDKIMSLGNLREKWNAFGFNVIEVNGHDVEELINAFNQTSYKPKCVIAHTVKGKGVSFMENKTEWHSLHFRDNQKYLKKALLEIGGKQVEG